MSQLMIRIGHSAYKSGANQQRTCFSKDVAISVLIQRGVGRKRAQEVIKQAIESPQSHLTCSTKTGDVVEVSNISEYIGQYTSNDLDALKRYWRGKS